MTDISSIVRYDRAVPVDFGEIMPGARGLVWHVKHIDCDAAVEAGKIHDKAGLDVERGIAVLAACVASWEWGENTWHGEVPELSEEKAREILTEARWMVAPLVKAAQDLGNFTAD
ncbi:MAG: hypothetical protein AAFY43_07355 [Pseudomonadota bacterium]